MKDTLIVNLYGGPGTGKCFGKGTKILMCDGSVKPVEDIQIGDCVMGDDSTPRKVLELHHGQSPLYLLKRRHSQDVIVSENHILSLMRYHVNKTWRFYDIRIDDYLNTSKKNQHYSRLYKRAVDFSNTVNNCALKIDPYYLGYWLGDGLSSSTSRFCTADAEIVERFRQLAVTLGLTLKQHSFKNGPCQTYCMSAGNIGNHKNHPLSGKLYNLVNNKHIPYDYMVAPLHERFELIAGLIDSDGSYSGTSYDWVNKNKNLAYDFYRLVNSCGLRATITTCTKSCKNYTGKYYRVCITGDISKIPVIIERKKCKIQLPCVDCALHECFSVNPIGCGDYYGFTVDGNGRFLLDDCTVVHNSTGAAYIFSLLKMNGVDAEYVTEFAKDKVWEGNKEVFNCQFYITGTQAFRIHRCFGKVDVIVTDSPIRLGKIYADCIGRKLLGMACVEEADGYREHSLDIFLKRVKPYNPNGRNQTENESKSIDKDILDMLAEQKVPYYTFNGDIDGYNKICRLIMDTLKVNKKDNINVTADKISNT